MKKALPLVIVLAVAAVAAYFLIGPGKDNDESTQDSEQEAAEESEQDSEQGSTEDSESSTTTDTSDTSDAASTTDTTDAAGSAQVTIDNSKFSPEEITVNAGDEVTWKNEDGTAHFVATDNHPSHTILPGMESQVLDAGESWSFVFDEVGEWDYHCHLHPNETGTVIVE